MLWMFIGMSVLCGAGWIYAGYLLMQAEYYENGWKRCRNNFSDVQRRCHDWEARAQSAESKLAKIKKITDPK